MKLWVDDLRHPPGNAWVWATTSEAAVNTTVSSTIGSEGRVEVGHAERLSGLYDRFL